LIDIARALGFTQLEGSHFLDNPASGRVLEKLGFKPLGISAPRLSCARGAEAQARLLRLTLAAEENEALAA
jgi:RimJ/RimL family protein N-acetyltransferase